MKTFLMILALTTSITTVTAATTHEEKVSGELECEASGSYVDLLKNFNLTLEDNSVREQKYEGRLSKAMWLSQTECEDNTDLYVSVKDWADFKAGKKVWVSIVHAEPDFELKGQFHCQLKQ